MSFFRLTNQSERKELFQRCSLRAQTPLPTPTFQPFHQQTAIQEVQQMLDIVHKFSIYIAIPIISYQIELDSQTAIQEVQQMLDIVHKVSIYRNCDNIVRYHIRLDSQTAIQEVQQCWISYTKFRYIAIPIISYRVELDSRLIPNTSYSNHDGYSTLHHSLSFRRISKCVVSATHTLDNSLFKMPILITKACRPNFSEPIG